MTKTIKTTDHQAIASAISKGESWKSNGSLKGQPQSYGVFSFGHLPDKWWGSCADADYAIFSYATPIAWKTQGQWHQPAVKYSVTTSKQQSYVAKAIAIVTA